MTKFEDMSRDELIQSAKSMNETLLYNCNNPAIFSCPFCHGTGFVSTLKYHVKAESLCEEWSKNVTQEEYETWWEKKYGPSGGK
jgi:hypothetical protein